MSTEIDWSGILANEPAHDLEPLDPYRAAGDALEAPTASGNTWTPEDAQTEAEAQAARTDRARRMFPRLDWHALWADDTDEEWIHYPLLPARRSVVIYSPPKVGKSLLVLELAVCVSRGGAFLGHQMERRYRVLYIDFENDPRGDVRTRLQAMGYGPDDLDHLDYLSFPTMGGLDTERGALELMEAVNAYGSEVVIIDTVSRAVDGEENSNDTWLGLYRRTGLRLKQAGVAMLRLDHTGKDESKGQRGGSAKSGDVDAIWKLGRAADGSFRLECLEARLHFESKSLHITRHTTPYLSHSVDMVSLVSEREAKVVSLVELANAHDLPTDASREDLRKLAKDRGIRARNDVFAEALKRRKAVPESSPENTPRGQAEAVPTPSGQPTNQLALTTGNTCPQPSGTAGDSHHRPPSVPVPRSLERDRGQHRDSNPEPATGDTPNTPCPLHGDRPQPNACFTCANLAGRGWES